MRYKSVLILLVLTALIMNASGQKTSTDWTQEGANLANLGKYNESISAYDRAIQLKPGNIAAWNGKGLALFYLGKYNESLGEYDKAIQLNPKNAAAWNGKGLALFYLGKYNESIKAFDQAIKLNPANSDYQEARNLVLNSLNNGSNGSFSGFNAKNNTNVNQPNASSSIAENQYNLALNKSANQSSVYDGNQIYTVSEGAEENLTTSIINGSTKLLLNKTTFSPNEKFNVYFEAPANFNRSAWVGIVPSNVTHGSESENDKYDLMYQYLEKRTSGTLSFNAPNKIGNYDLRMFDTDRDGREVASVSFTVTSTNLTSDEVIPSSTMANKSINVGEMDNNVKDPGTMTK